MEVGDSGDMKWVCVRNRDLDVMGIDVVSISSPEWC